MRSEATSLGKATKYNPAFPGSFGGVAGARAFRGPFFSWCNCKIRHWNPAGAYESRRSSRQVVAPRRCPCSQSQAILANFKF